MSQRLMIFAKAPEPGRVKTRLRLPPEDAARLHEAFVADVVERHQAPNRQITVWRAGDLKHAFWDGLDVKFADQVPGDLGVRMASAFNTELGSGDPVVILGTDSPTLPPERVDEAFELLESAPAVIGPACDGGYYLLGLNGSVPGGVFDPDIEWGGDGVLLDTLARLRAHGSFKMLDFWYDVDRPADLRLLRIHLQHARNGSFPLPPRTTELLEGEGRHW